MKHVYKKIFYVIFAMISIFFSCETINADDGIVINRVGFNENGTGGGSSSCMSQWGACWNYPYNLGFRLTLIYASGENAGMKVNDTISVDFSSNEIFNKNSDKFIFGNNSNYHAHFGGRKYGYKYSDDFVNEKGEPYTASDATDFVYAYVSGHSKPFENSNSLGIFLNNDFRMVRSTGWECDTDEGPEPCSFFDLFLHLCKFLDLDEVHYDDTTSKKDDLKKYVILIEPTYSVEYKVYDSNTNDYVTLNRYGTINEIAKEMKKTTADDGFGLEAGLGRVLANNSPLCINNAQKTEYLSNFSRIKNPVERCNAGIAEGNVYDPYGKHKSTYISEIASSDFSRGMNIGVIPGVTGEFTLSARPLNNENFSFQLNSCNLFNENKISLSTTSNEPLSPEAILKENTKILKNEESADENQSVYCYDVVDYNFDDTVNYLNDHKFNRFTFINPPSSTAEVNRYCLLGATATYNVKSDLQSYKDNGIQLYFYGKEYDVLPAESDIDVSEEIISNDLDISDTLSHYKYIRYSFELKYNYPKNTIYIGENYNQDYDSKKNMNQAYITLKKWKESFGRSNKLINTLGLDSLSTGNILSDFLVYKNYGQIDIKKKNGENIKNDISCSIDYTIEKNKTNINFRVISLDNPFPARDGTSRMPAENWLYDENNVYEYITTNRGRVTEDVYRKVEKINE